MNIEKYIKISKEQRDIVLLKLERMSKNYEDIDNCFTTEAETDDFSNLI